jgi:hypothetical protein
MMNETLPLSAVAAALVEKVMREHGPWQEQLSKAQIRAKSQDTTTPFYVSRQNSTGSAIVVVPNYQPPHYPDPTWHITSPATGDWPAHNTYGDWRWCLGFRLDGTAVTFDHLDEKTAYSEVTDGPEIQQARELLRKIGFPEPRRY